MESNNTNVLLLGGLSAKKYVRGWGIQNLDFLMFSNPSQLQRPTKNL